MRVSSEVVRVYKVVHTWTGILSGMALFIAFYAGALTIFKEPLSRWATPPDPAAVHAPQVALAEAQTLINRTLTGYPETARGFQLNLSHEDAATERLEWNKRPEGTDEHDLFAVQRFVATLDSGGAVEVREANHSGLPLFIDVLHRVVGLPVDDDATRLFMGVVAGLYFLALVSGLIVLLPSLVKDLFALRVGPNLKRMWLDAHNVVGLGSLPFHLVIALTAAVFAFHDVIYMAQNQLVHEGKLGAALGGGPAEGEPRDPTEMLPPEQLVAKVTALAPDFEPTSLEYLQVTSPRASVRVWGQDAQAVHARTPGGFAIVDPYSGRILTTEYLPGHQSVAGEVLATLFGVHFATYGGMSIKWLYFLLGLLGAWLFYSGNLLWIETRRKKAKQHLAGGALPTQRRTTTWMAAITVGICLGAVCGISAMIASTKWLHGHVADPNEWYSLVYYAVFFAALGWSCVRGGPRAAVELLRLAAVLTVAIPFTTVLAAAFPGLGLWYHQAPVALGVDAVALLMALVFAWIARATARRVYGGGPEDSVWTASAPRPLPWFETPVDATSVPVGNEASGS